MNEIWTVARKELRGFFNSAVAVIFLAIFLAAVLFFFFFVDKFFSRGVADIRPLFDRLPFLLIFLVAALTMRMWSEEQKVGTLEVLLTLPISRWKLVLGKFVAGMVLVKIALLLTFGVPITVAILGNIDWGPVVGGYVAAALLAAAYLAIGLCISSLTDNQIVSLMLTIVAGVALFIPGTSAVLEAVGYPTSELFRAIGTGSRFESIARGVLDLRDLVYWITLIGFFLVLNVFILRTKSWSKGPRTASARRGASVAVILILANALLLNLWLSPIRSLRFDLTQDKEYSLSPVTKRLVRSLEEPLVVRGYFSAKTHPLLAPLVPQIRDRLMEYKAIGGGNIRVEFVDPSTDEELENEALEKYNIRSFPFRFNERNAKSVVNAFFHILIKYGDQQEVLSFEDLVEVTPIDVGDIKVELRNLEYDITKTIKKVAFGFQSLDTLFASMPTPPKLTFFVTKDELPDNLKDAAETIKKVVGEIEAEAGGSLNYTEIEVTTPEQQQELFEKYGLRPYSGGLLSGTSFYMHIILELGDQILRVAPPNDMKEAGIKQTLTEALKRGAPGFVKTVGLVTPKPVPPSQPQFPGQPPAQPQPPQSFNQLQQRLQESYEVQAVDLTSGRVGDAIDVLIVAGPDALTQPELSAIDQFLMRGGAVIVLAGRYRLSLQGRGLAIAAVDPGMDELLAGYGIKVEAKLIADTESDSFPIPVDRPLGNGMVIQEIQQLPYPFFLKIKGDSIASHVTTGSLNAIVAHFASPVTLMTPQAKSEGDTGDEIKTTRLLESSSSAWLTTDLNVNPDFKRYPEAGFGRPKEVPSEDKGPHVVAVLATGAFSSPFAKPAEGQEGAEAQTALLERAPADTRLAVVGSSGFVSDTLIQVSSQAGSADIANNLDFILNLVDWSLADTDLLTIRSRGARTRGLDLEEGGGSKWEIINYVIALLGLGLFVGFTLVRRKSIRPFDLDPRAKGGWTGRSGGLDDRAGAISDREEELTEEEETTGEEE